MKSKTSCSAIIKCIIYHRNDFGKIKRKWFKKEKSIEFHPLHYIKSMGKFDDGYKIFFTDGYDLDGIDELYLITGGKIG